MTQRIKYFNSEIIVDDNYLYATGLMSPVVYYYKNELFLDYYDLKKKYGKELVVNPNREVILSYAFKYNTKDFDMQMFSNVEQISLWKEIRINNGKLEVKYQKDDFFKDKFNMDRVEEWYHKWHSILNNKSNCIYDLTGGKDSRIISSFYRDNEVATEVYVRWTKKPFNTEPYDREIAYKLVERFNNDNINFTRNLNAKKLLIEGYGTEPFRNQENNISYVMYLEQFHKAWKDRKVCPFVDDLLLGMNWTNHGEEAHDYLLHKYCSDVCDLDFHTKDRGPTYKI